MREIYKGVVIRWSNIHNAFVVNPTGCWVMTTDSIEGAKSIIDSYID